MVTTSLLVPSLLGKRREIKKEIHRKKKGKQRDGEKIEREKKRGWGRERK